MSTIIINASPKGNVKNSNTRIISEEFIRNMKAPCDISFIVNSDLEELKVHVEQYDTIIFILPLYIHAMPGIMMNFIEHLKPTTEVGKSMGFIIQAGFIETAQEKYVECYFAALAKQLNYHYLGTVSKGEAAGIYMFPKMFKKVLRKINKLGEIYEITHAFDQKLTEELGKPYTLSKSQVRRFQFLCDIGLNNIGWHKVLRQNKALDKRLDRPFI